MSNGKEMINQLDFETRMKGMSDRELQEFTARQLYEHCEHEKGLEGRVVTLEGRDNKIFLGSGGIGGVIAGVIVGLANLFLKRGG